MSKALMNMTVMSFDQMAAIRVHKVVGRLIMHCNENKHMIILPNQQGKLCYKKLCGSRSIRRSDFVDSLSFMEQHVLT